MSPASGAAIQKLRERVIVAAILAALPPLVLIANGVADGVQGKLEAFLQDGLNLWCGPHLFFVHMLSTLFDPWAYGSWFDANFGGDRHTWSYPPSFLLLVLPLGLLPPVAAVLSFEIFSSLCLVAALRVSGFGWMLALAVLLSPASLANLRDAQNGALFAALLIGGVFLRDRRPWLAGFFIGLVTMKPQLGLLLPIYLVAGGCWRSIVSAALTGGALVLLSAWMFTWHSWTMFISQVMPFMQQVMLQLTARAHHGPRAEIMSIFSFVQQMGCGASVAKAVQLAATLGAAIFTWRLGRAKTLPRPQRDMLVLLLIVLATPYVWFYDMLPTSLGVAFLVREGLAQGFRRGELVSLLLLWATPGLAIYATLTGLPSFAPPFVLLALYYGWTRLSSAEAVPQVSRNAVG